MLRSLAGLAAAAEPIELARGVAPQHPQQPQVAVDAAGAVHVVYGIGDSVRYQRSTDAGQTFSETAEVAVIPNMSLGMRRGPRIAAAKGGICVTAIGGKQGKGRDGDVVAMRSADGGKTWSQPVAVNDAADSAREGLHAMAPAPDGRLCCVWLDLRNRKTDLMASCSTDGGSTWGANVLVYRSPDGSVCECCHPSVAIDREGRILVLWRNSLGGARDMYLASSSDGGSTFSDAAKLGAGTWPLDACPMDGGAIAVTADGKAAAVWRREKTVYLSIDGQSEERRLGPGEQPSIAATKEGLFIVWLKKRGDVAYLLKPGDKTPRELATHAADPVIAAPQGGKGPVVLVWEGREGNNYTIYCQSLGDAP
jgi:hypothetical protein